MIKVDNISKQFKRIENDDTANKGSFGSIRKSKSKAVEFMAVDGISLFADSGEILGILGPNGAGKTTLLRMIGKLMEPTSGQVIITDSEGNEITSDVEMKKHIGYLSGNTKLYHRFSIREMLEMFGDIYGMDKESTAIKIQEISDVLDLDGFIDNRIERLSTGQTQRANISRCLIHSPEIYIFDEPTLGLDIISSQAIIDFMKTEKEKGKTVLYSTHYMEEAQYLCDRIIMMHHGHIVKEGTPQSIMDDTGTTNLRDAFKVVIDVEENSNTKSEEFLAEEVEDITLISATDSKEKIEDIKDEQQDN